MNLVATMMSTNFSTARVSANSSSSEDFQNVMDKKTDNPVQTAEAVATSTNNEQSQTKVIREHQAAYNSKRVEVLNKQQDSDETLVEDMSELSEVIVTKIAALLNITEEELKDMLNTLDMEVTDLFIPEKLHEFAAFALNTEEFSDILVNETFGELVSDLRQILNESLKAVDLTMGDVKNFEALVEQSKTESVKEQVVPEVVTNTEAETNTVKQETQEQDGLVQEAVQSDTSRQSNSDNDQTSEFMSRFDQTLNQVVTEKTTVIQVGGFEETIQTQVTAKNILDQIVTQMKVVSVGEKATLSFQLQPENLGKVAFSISNDNGNITGQFMAENATVKEALEMNLQNLRSNLMEQGIKVDEIKVVVGNTSEFMNQQQQQQFNQQQQNQKRRRAIKIEDISHMTVPDDVEINDILTRDGLVEHSVEFSA